jgi:tRNA A-37 threonylcarbamoyl transferase component Bud32
VRASRAPWWLFLIAASFLSFLTLQLYLMVWGVEGLGFSRDYVMGAMIVQRVFPGGAGARSGLLPGDRVLAIDGIPLLPKGERSSSFVAFANFEIGRPIPLKIERDGKQFELPVNLQLGSPRDLDWGDWQLIGGGVFAIILALVIAFRRPHDLIALTGACLLASSTFAMLLLDYGGASVWRHLPTPMGFLLWPAFITRGLISGFCLAFAAIFPRRLFRARWIWALIWTPVVLVAALQCLLHLLLVYQPRSVPTWLVMLSPDFVWSFSCLLFYLPATLVVSTIQYRTLQDINQRRRLRIWFAGLAICSLSAMTLIVLNLIAPASISQAVYSSPLSGVLFTLYLTGPLAFAYVIFHHRVFDLGLILRRGLQYALARRLLVSAVPALAAIFIADLFLHGDQPILVVFRTRGWMYAALAALAAVAYMKRRSWLESLDHRFFREQFDARRLLCEVVEEVHSGRSLEQEAPRVTSRIEAALHSEFVALLVNEPRELFYRALAVAPAGTGPPPLQKESKLLSLIRLLGKPLEVPQSESGWLQQQLPHEETEFLRQGRVDLLVPVATDPQRTEVLLVLGAKRSEEPYSNEDQDLLVAIAASLAILLEKPTGTPTRSDIFEECPQCGSCYDSGSGRCSQEGARLVPVILPRVLEGRYHLERRLGRGGMGTVYAASDASLERRVAVKVIREDLLGSAEAAERFRREARTAANFAHPNVVTVFDFGVASGARAFLVMEILEGVTLRERLQAKNHLPATQLLCISRDVCAALSAAHRRQLVHRDLKPENIFLVATDSGEVAKVLDFGVAKFLSNRSEELTVDTAAGAILGTPRYMSPEQRAGQAPHHAWDLWAFAVITYEMLTGSYPFESSCHDRLATGPVVPFVPVDKHIPQASKKWQSLFDHSFARELSDRHDSAEAFLSELQSAAS